MPALTCAALAMTSHSNAAVVVTFEQVGSDVVATWTGAIGPGSFGNDLGFLGSYADDNGLFSVFDVVDAFTGGASVSTKLSGIITMTSGSIRSFGFVGDAFYVTGEDDDMANLTVVDFTGTASTMVFRDQTLASIGAASFNNTLAWTSSAGGSNTVSYTTIIPEPSTAIMGLIGVGLGLARRRR